MRNTALSLSVLVALAASLLVFHAPPVLSDDRTEPVDIIVALDKSLSMEEEIEAVKRYVNSRIVDDILQNGDFFLVISFFGKAPVVISDYVQGEDHKEQIKQQISSIEADGDWTDIGNALDKLKEEVRKRSAADRKKTLLLITDGKHEPPPDSRYYSSDGSVSHEYLERASETRKEGWKIFVLGLGTESAKEIADQLSAEYIEAPEGASSDQITEAVPDLVGSMEVEGAARVAPVRYNGMSELTLTVSTDLYDDPVVVEISRIGVRTSELSQDNLLGRPFRAELPAEGELTLHIPLEFSNRFEPGRHEGTLQLAFASREHFANELPVRFRVNTLLQNFWWLIPILLVLLALIGLIVWKVAGGKKVRFRLAVEESPLPKGKDTFTARQSKPLYLKESTDIVDVSEADTVKTIASLAVTDEGGLSLNVLKEERFPELKGQPKNVLGKTIVVRTESGKDYHVGFLNTG